MWKAAVERPVNVFQRHAAGQAFENQRDSQPSAADRQLPAEQLWIGYDPLIILVRGWLPTGHRNLVGFIVDRPGPAQAACGAPAPADGPTLPASNVMLFAMFRTWVLLALA